MSFAVIQTGGKQYKVEVGDILKIEKLSQEAKPGEKAKIHDEGAKITFDKILLVDDGSATKIGMPYIAGATVGAIVLGDGRHKKIDVVKYRAKSRYHKKNGHRQPFTEVKIESIG